MDKRDHEQLKKALRKHKRLIQALDENAKHVRRLWRNCVRQHRSETATALVAASLAVESAIPLKGSSGVMDETLLVAQKGRVIH